MAKWRLEQVKLVLVFSYCQTILLFFLLSSWHCRCACFSPEHLWLKQDAVNRSHTVLPSLWICNILSSGRSPVKNAWAVCRGEALWSEKCRLPKRFMKKGSFYWPLTCRYGEGKTVAWCRPSLTSLQKLADPGETHGLIFIHCSAQSSVFFQTETSGTRSKTEVRYADV